MKNRVIQEFLGEINNVQIDDKNIYCSTNYLLETIEEKFGEVYTEEFIIELKNTINIMNFKYENFSYSDLEHEFYNCIDTVDSFEEIEFEYFGSDWKIEYLNECIAEGKFTKQNVLELEL